MDDPARTIGVSVGVACGLLAFAGTALAGLGRVLTWQARRR